MGSGRALLLMAVVCMIWLTGVSCSHGIEAKPVGSLTHYGICKQFQDGTDTFPAHDEPSSAEACVEYQYDGVNRLTLKHINAGFNCCPGEIHADISIDKGVIWVVESEAQAMCNCTCLYDLDFEINNLGTGEYVISIVEPYLDSHNEKLEFLLDLSSSMEGSYCVDREGEPWM